MPRDDGGRLFAGMLIILPNFATQAQFDFAISLETRGRRTQFPPAHKMKVMTEPGTRQNPLWILISERRPIRTTPFTRAANRNRPRQTASGAPPALLKRGWSNRLLIDQGARQRMRTHTLLSSYSRCERRPGPAHSSASARCSATTGLIGEQVPSRLAARERIDSSCTRIREFSPPTDGIEAVRTEIFRFLDRLWVMAICCVGEKHLDGRARFVILDRLRHCFVIAPPESSCLNKRPFAAGCAVCESESLKPLHAPSEETITFGGS